MPSRAASASWPDAVLAGSIIALAGMSWWILWMWGRSPSGHLLMHGSAHAGAGHGWYYGGVAVLGWTLMTVAMMLPTTTPLLLLFRRMTANKADAAVLICLLIVGYLAVWASFGVVVQLGSRAFQWGFSRIAFPASTARVADALILTVAGIYQFTPLKYACLEKCRTPMSFIVSHWHGGNRAWQALVIGLDHGAFCVGCCWSLMLLMFVVGMGNLGWMLLLGVVMAVEKNFPWGRRISAPLGWVLLIWAAGVVLAGWSGGSA